MEYRPSLEPGQVYIPYKLFVGIFVPSALCRCSDLSEGAKLLFGLLALHSGKDGHCNPSQECLAGELAKSVATIGRWQQELIRACLIRVRRVGSGRSNEFEFRWNPILASS